VLAEIRARGRGFDRRRWRSRRDERLVRPHAGGSRRFAVVTGRAYRPKIIGPGAASMRPGCSFGSYLVAEQSCCRILL